MVMPFCSSPFFWVHAMQASISVQLAVSEWVLSWDGGSPASTYSCCSCGKQSMFEERLNHNRSSSVLFNNPLTVLSSFSVETQKYPNKKNVFYISWVLMQDECPVCSPDSSRAAQQISVDNPMCVWLNFLEQVEGFVVVWHLLVHCWWPLQPAIKPNRFCRS